ncbi:hypothetical protein B0H16DRAFT_1587763 [Mycena metata]|uniref:Uncharacterized protein n=1 Tax=Mycena metata TaxID=1033252 RepID=A0AAD7HV61_9AGAR|nr:hypothetical protein B0H16DRAFT_1587763 [Mycena metata]
MRSVSWTSRLLSRTPRPPRVPPASLHTLSSLSSPFLPTLPSLPAATGCCWSRMGESYAPEAVLPNQAGGHATRIPARSCCTLLPLAPASIVIAPATRAKCGCPSPGAHPCAPSASRPRTRRSCAAAVSSRRGLACVDVDAPIAGATQNRSARTPSCSRRGGGG